MSILSKDTIVAIASAPLAAGVAVIRISGSKAKQLADNLSPSFANCAPRFMHYSKVVSSKGDVLDDSMLAYFKAPASFTGEDVVEIHCHGGVAVTQVILDELLSQNGVRHADHGEFTRRAFLNGKLDLTEAEAIADLVDAETEEQRKQALRQLNGELGSMFEGWRQDIMHLVAHVEAAIDFPDEELEIMEEAGLKTKVDALTTSLNKAIETNAGCRIRDGFNVVIIGKPNAGKSTLTNLLTGKETAIVSEIAGTTRDVLETRLDIAGYPVILADTAGIRQTKDVIEKEGVSRAKNKQQEADLTILVADSADYPNLDSDLVNLLHPNKSLVILTKADKLEKAPSLTNEEVKHVLINLHDENALSTIIEELTHLIKQTFASSQKSAQLSRERHRESVRNALSHLNRAMEMYNNPTAASLAELLAQDLRDAASSIGQVTGRTDTEDVLDLVFSTFCIGK